MDFPPENNMTSSFEIGENLESDPSVTGQSSLARKGHRRNATDSVVTFADPNDGRGARMNDLTDATRTDGPSSSTSAMSNFTVGWKGGNNTTTIPSSSHGALDEDQLEGGSGPGNGNLTLGGLGCGSLSAPDLQHFLMTTDSMEADMQSHYHTQINRGGTHSGRGTGLGPGLGSASLDLGQSPSAVAVSGGGGGLRMQPPMKRLISRRSGGSATTASSSEGLHGLSASSRDSKNSSNHSHSNDMAAANSMLLDFFQPHPPSPPSSSSGNHLEGVGSGSKNSSGDNHHNIINITTVGGSKSALDSANNSDDKGIGTRAGTAGSSTAPFAPGHSHSNSHSVSGVGDGDAGNGGYGGGMGGLGTLSCMSIDDTTLLMTASSTGAGHNSSSIVGGGGGMLGQLGGDQYQHANASMLKVSSEDWNEPWRNALDSDHHNSNGIDGGGIQLGPGARAAAALMASNAADRAVLAMGQGLGGMHNPQQGGSSLASHSLAMGMSLGDTLGMGSIGLNCMSVAGGGGMGGGLPVVVSQASSGPAGLSSGGLDGGLGLLGEYDEFMQFSFQSASLDILDSGIGGSASGAFFGSSTVTGANSLGGGLGGMGHRQSSYLGGGGVGQASSSSSAMGGNGALIIDTDNLTFEQLQLLQHGKSLTSLPLASGGVLGGMPKPQRPLNTMGPTATKPGFKYAIKQPVVKKDAKSGAPSSTSAGNKASGPSATSSSAATTAAAGSFSSSSSSSNPSQAGTTAPSSSSEGIGQMNLSSLSHMPPPTHGPPPSSSGLPPRRTVGLPGTMGGGNGTRGVGTMGGIGRHHRPANNTHNSSATATASSSSSSSSSSSLSSQPLAAAIAATLQQKQSSSSLLSNSLLPGQGQELGLGLGMGHPSGKPPTSSSSFGAGHVPISSHSLDLGLSMSLDLAMGASMDLIGDDDDGDEEDEDIDYVDNLLSHSNSHQDDRSSRRGLRRRGIGLGSGGVSSRPDDDDGTAGLRPPLKRTRGVGGMANGSDSDASGAMGLGRSQAFSLHAKSSGSGMVAYGGANADPDNAVALGADLKQGTGISDTVFHGFRRQQRTGSSMVGPGIGTSAASSSSSMANAFSEYDVSSDGQGLGQASSSSAWGSEGDKGGAGQGANASSRGRYKCGRCGLPKTNHVCEYYEDTSMSSTGTQMGGPLAVAAAAAWSKSHGTRGHGLGRGGGAASSGFAIIDIRTMQPFPGEKFLVVGGGAQSRASAFATDHEPGLGPGLEEEGMMMLGDQSTMYAQECSVGGALPSSDYGCVLSSSAMSSSGHPSLTHPPHPPDPSSEQQPLITNPIDTLNTDNSNNNNIDNDNIPPLNNQSHHDSSSSVIDNGGWDGSSGGICAPFPSSERLVTMQTLALAAAGSSTSATAHVNATTPAVMSGGLVEVVQTATVEDNNTNTNINNHNSNNNSMDVVSNDVPTSNPIRSPAKGSSSSSVGGSVGSKGSGRGSSLDLLSSKSMSTSDDLAEPKEDRKGRSSHTTNTNTSNNNNNSSSSSTRSSRSGHSRDSGGPPPQPATAATAAPSSSAAQTQAMDTESSSSKNSSSSNHGASAVAADEYDAATAAVISALTSPRATRTMIQQQQQHQQQQQQIESVDKSSGSGTRVRRNRSKNDLT